MLRVAQPRGCHLQQAIKKHNMSCNCKMCTREKNEAVRQGEEKMPSRFKLQNLQCSLIIHNDPRGEGGGGLREFMYDRRNNSISRIIIPKLGVGFPR